MRCMRADAYRPGAPAHMRPHAHDKNEPTRIRHCSEPTRHDTWPRLRRCGDWASPSRTHGHICAGTRSKCNDPFAVLVHIANGDSIPEIPATIR